MTQSKSTQPALAPHTYDAWGDHRVLVAIPVYNEQKYIPAVISKVLQYARDVLVIDDGSTDDTPMLLARQPVNVLRHPRNAGYGRSLRDAFTYADANGYDWVITMDCDEQHEPAAIPHFINEATRTGSNWDIVSGSRYIASLDETTQPPADRRAINQTLTEEINARLGLNLTDSFCGFKAHRVSALRKLRLTETGYAFPMQLWVQAVAHNLHITEIPVKLIYKDLTRSFGAQLNDPSTRLAHYRKVLHCEILRHCNRLPPQASQDAITGCA